MTTAGGATAGSPTYTAPQDLIERATSWRDDDPDEATRAELDDVLEAGRLAAERCGRLLAAVVARIARP